MTHYAILIGSNHAKNVERINAFPDADAAASFAETENKDFRAAYASDDDYNNDPDAAEWVVMSAADAERDYPELIAAQ